MKNFEINCLVAIAMIGLVAACNKDPVKVANSSNAQIQVEELFTYKGCTMHRFRDDRAVYFMICPKDDARTAEVDWNESCGKNCVRPMSVRTE